MRSLKTDREPKGPRRVRRLALLAALGVSLLSLAAVESVWWSPAFDPRVARGVGLGGFVAAVAGALLAQATATVERRRTRQRLVGWVALWAAGVGLLAALGLATLRGVPGGGGGIVVIGWRQQPECREASPPGFGGPNCHALGVADCLRGLAYRQDAVDLCWGRVQTLTVRIVLVGAYLGVSASAGAAIGLSVLVTASSRRPRIFVSYRRADCPRESRLVHRRLADSHGSANVFIDDRSLEPGRDWREGIVRNLGASDLVVAMIGPRWASHRLEERDDLVRSELSAALEREIPVLPVLVEGAAPPVSGELPPELARLANLQAFVWNRDANDRRELDRLARRVAELLDRPAERVTE